MKLVIEINLDNAAFDPEWWPEVERILSGLPRKIADHEPGDTPQPLMDYNGNRVGTARIEE